MPILLRVSMIGGIRKIIICGKDWAVSIIPARMDSDCRQNRNGRLNWLPGTPATPPGRSLLPLKLVVSAGFRTYFDGKVDGMGTTGSYWSSTVNGNFSRRFNYSFDGFSFDDYARAQGFSVRCIKD
jgi:hypothetical protein